MGALGGGLARLAGFVEPVAAPATFPLMLGFAGTAANLAWPPQAGTVSYRVYAGLRDTALAPAGAEQGGNSAALAGLAYGDYAFQVTAQLGEGRSLCSLLARNLYPPAVTATAGDGQVQLDFAPLAGATAYNVYLGTAPGAEDPQPLPQALSSGPWAQANDGGFQVNGLADGTTYYFLVQGVFAGWLGQCSAEVPATPQPPAPPVTITWDPALANGWSLSNNNLTATKS